MAQVPFRRGVALRRLAFGAAAGGLTSAFVAPGGSVGSLEARPLRGGPRPRT